MNSSVLGLVQKDGAGARPKGSRCAPSGRINSCIASQNKPSSRVLEILRRRSGKAVYATPHITQQAVPCRTRNTAALPVLVPSTQQGLRGPLLLQRSLQSCSSTSCFSHPTPARAGHPFDLCVPQAKPGVGWGADGRCWRRSLAGSLPHGAGASARRYRQALRHA
jgi:hypothetical protein